MAWTTEFPKLVCSVENCNEPIRSKGLCRIHYQRMYVQGRTERIKQKREGVCSVECCGKSIKGRGFCANHLQLFRRNGAPTKLTKTNRKHPYYHLWFERKQAGILCEAWLDFKIFANDVGIRPEGNFVLVRIEDRAYGPDNFKWQEHLKKKEGETDKDWYARKWQAQRQINPALNRERNYKRNFQLSMDEYNNKLKNQNFTCEICKQPETAIDGRTGNLKNLAIDHCHDSGKIRDLLCWRCNTLLGRSDDSIVLLQTCINYLIKHKD